MKRYIYTLNGENYYSEVFGMSYLRAKSHGYGFRFWLDLAGDLRNLPHHYVRYKFDNGNDESSCIFIVPEDGSTPYLDIEHTDPKHIKLFKYEEDAVEFLEIFQKVLIWYWYHKITESEATNIIHYVQFDGLSIDEAINIVLYENIYKDIYSIMSKISKISDWWNNAVKQSCYYTDIQYVPKDESIIQKAKNLLDIMNDENCTTNKLCGLREALKENVDDIENLQ